MMQLIDTLIDRGAIGEDTVVTLAAQRRQTARDYLVLSINQGPRGYDLQLREMDGQSLAAASSTDIVAIDGMAIDRYADVYNINRDGSCKQVGKKRGRKPKIRLATADQP